jgi:hypothetical protein
LVLAGAPGCGYAVFQTAHTEAPGAVSVSAGLSTVSNELDDDPGAGRSVLTNLAGDSSVRVGITDQLDVGVAPFFVFGLRADAKLNLFDNAQPYALAPRLGVGYSALDGSTYLAFAGLIGSYRLGGWFEPYVSATLADYWVYLDDPFQPTLAPNERLAEREHTGNGLLQLALGAELSASKSVSFLFEYGRWLPIWNDPGDSYKFVENSLAGAALRVRFGG